MCEKTKCNDLFENSIFVFLLFAFCSSSIYATQSYTVNTEVNTEHIRLARPNWKAISRVDLCGWVVALDWNRTAGGTRVRREKSCRTYEIRCTDVRMYYPIAVQHSGKRVYFRWRQHQHLVSIKKIIAHNMSSFKWQQIAFRFSYIRSHSHHRSRITISIVQWIFNGWIKIAANKFITIKVNSLSMVPVPPKFFATFLLGCGLWDLPFKCH